MTFVFAERASITKDLLSEVSHGAKLTRESTYERTDFPVPAEAGQFYWPSKKKKKFLTGAIQPEQT